MSEYAKNIVYLSAAQYAELIANNTITVDDVTITYNDNDIYVTPQAEPITDVKINGTSIGSNGVANIPVAGAGNIATSTLGVVKGGNGIKILNNGVLSTDYAYVGDVKNGTSNYLTIAPSTVPAAAFYGLSKVAGVDLKNETVTLGTYPDTSKAAIQNMLGITNLLSTEEFSTATAAHALNSTFMMNGKLHRATAAIAIGDAVEVGTNCEVVKADEVFVKKTDYACNATAQTQRAGIIGKTPVWSGIQISGNGELHLQMPNDQLIKSGADTSRAILVGAQHKAVFYGLSKVAGVDLANETVTLGTYPETSKTAIRNMLGATSSNVIAVQDEQPTDTDTKVWLPETEAQGIQVPTMEDMANYVQKTDYADTTNYGIVKPGNRLTISNGIINVASSSENSIKTGITDVSFITPIHQHEATFYGLAKAAGDATQSISTNAVGTYTDDAKAAIQTMLGVPGDVQVNGTSVVSNGIANIPIASTSTFGAVKCGTGLSMMTGNNTGKINTNPASTSACKNGAEYYAPITPNHQHEATFYGLAKAAGDTTQSASSNAVGTYTTEAKAAIHTMLGIDPASIAAQVDIPLVETVSGTTPTITGQPNVRYVCGEVSTISITPPVSGSVDVIFESGSTATTMTVPSTVKWPAWFDAEALEANTTYEVLITDGIYGSVMTWAT